METTRLNITLPDELVKELNHVVGSRKKSRFIAATLMEKLKKMREEKQEELLKEGYQSHQKEDMEITNDFLYPDLEGWDEY